MRWGCASNSLYCLLCILSLRSEILTANELYHSCMLLNIVKKATVWVDAMNGTRVPKCAEAMTYVICEINACSSHSSVVDCAND